MSTFNPHPICALLYFSSMRRISEKTPCVRGIPSSSMTVLLETVLLEMKNSQRLSLLHQVRMFSSPGVNWKSTSSNPCIFLCSTLRLFNLAVCSCLVASDGLEPSLRAYETHVSTRCDAKSYSIERFSLYAIRVSFKIVFLRIRLPAS